MEGVESWKDPLVPNGSSSSCTSRSCRQSERGTSREECARQGASAVMEKRIAPHGLVNILARLTNHRPEGGTTLRLNRGEWRIVS
jgi:hypothetical protein